MQMQFSVVICCNIRIVDLLYYRLSLCFFLYVFICLIFVFLFVCLPYSLLVNNTASLDSLSLLILWTFCILLYVFNFFIGYVFVARVFLCTDGFDRRQRRIIGLIWFIYSNQTNLTMPGTNTGKKYNNRFFSVSAI